MDLTIADTTDDANGYATVTPRNAVVAFAAPPPAFSSLQNFDDWLGLLVAHEVTHVVHLDIVYGLPRAFNVLQGKRMAPNASLPAWFNEGLAVAHESAVTGAGRVHSSLFAMMLRTAAAEGALLRLDQLSHDPLVFPFASARYIYGAGFVQYLADRFGMAKVARLAHRFGEFVLPLGFDRLAQESFGEPLEDLFAQWQSDLQSQVKLQRQKLGNHRIEGHRLTFTGEGSTANLVSRFFPSSSERVLFQRNASTSQQAFVEMNLRTLSQHELARMRGAGMATVTDSHDNPRLIYEQQTFRPLRHRVLGDAFADGHDLFALSLRTGETQRLTHNARLSEPDVSPDGERIIAVQIADGRRQLVMVPIKGGAPEVVWSSVQGLAYSPTWSPAGDVVAFVTAAPGRRRCIHVMDLNTRQAGCVHDEAALLSGLRFSPDGRHLVFSSDRDGTYNIYALDLRTARLWQVTDVFAGAFAPVVSPDGHTVIYTGFTASGFDLFQMPFDHTAWRVASPVVLSQPLQTSSQETSVNLVMHNEPYQGWPHLYPRTWTVSARSDALGLGPSVGIETTASDPLFLHELGARVDTAAAPADTSIRLGYTWLGWFPTIALSGTRWVQGHTVQGNPVVGIPGHDYKVYGTSASLSSTLPLHRAPASRAHVTAGMAWRDAATDGAAPPSVVDTNASLAAYITASFDNALSYTRSIAPQSGRKLALALQHEQHAGPLQRGVNTTSATWTEYGTWPWARLHTWAVAASGGLSQGDGAGAFALGGYESQTLLRSLYQNNPQCCEFLRGYGAGSLVGQAYVRGSAEYRAPLVWIERGLGVFPIYLRRLHGAAFMDLGNASAAKQLFEDLKLGTGLELRLDLKFGFHTESTVMAGWARGLSAGGQSHVYVVMAFPF
ncbi:MAG: hypothetical protein SF187_27310 [Deltaproteobacteria bacterium]|nr:hypothetical protein [Deltaproteobacteria bacterium]